MRLKNVNNKYFLYIVESIKNNKLNKLNFSLFILNTTIA